jgi:N-formylglutamate deformylase
VLQFKLEAADQKMTQCSYMEERWPFEYVEERSAAVQPHLRAMLEFGLAAR